MDATKVLAALLEGHYAERDRSAQRDSSQDSDTNVDTPARLCGDNSRCLHVSPLSVNWNLPRSIAHRSNRPAAWSLGPARKVPCRDSFLQLRRQMGDGARSGTGDQQGSAHPLRPLGIRGYRGACGRCSLPSGGLEKAAQRLANQLGGRRAVGLGALEELVTQLGVQPDRLDARGRRAQRWPSALTPAGKQCLHLVACLGLRGKRLDPFVGDGLARPGVAVCAIFAHRSINLLYL